MAGQAQLRCVPLKIYLDLPWWPTDVSRTLSVRNVSELERADKRPLAVPTSLTPDDYSIGYTLRHSDYRTPVAGHLNDLETIARSKTPVQLLLADQTEGLFRIESASVTVLEFAANGKPSVADVSLTLKRASDAQVKVGLIKRIKGRGKNMARRR